MGVGREGDHGEADGEGGRAWLGFGPWGRDATRHWRPRAVLGERRRRERQTQTQYDQPGNARRHAIARPWAASGVSPDSANAWTASKSFTKHVFSMGAMSRPSGDMTVAKKVTGR